MGAVEQKLGSAWTSSHEAEEIIHAIAPRVAATDAPDEAAPPEHEPPPPPTEAAPTMTAPARTV